MIAPASSERHGAAARGLQQCRPVEAAEHDAEASVERHLAEHLRRGHAGGEGCLGHQRLLLADPRRETFLEQFYDLTGAQAWMSAVPPWLIFSPRDPRIARPPAGRDQTPTAGKRERSRHLGRRPFTGFLLPLGGRTNARLDQPMSTGWPRIWENVTVKARAFRFLASIKLHGQKVMQGLKMIPDKL